MGRMNGMTKTKVSVTVDPLKLEKARALVGAASVSELIGVALDRLILDVLERRHTAAYVRQPPDLDDIAWAELERDPSDIADDIDWAQLYGISPR